MKLVHIRFSGKVRSGVMHANPNIWKALGEANQRNVINILADMPGHDPQIDGRSMAFPLDRPVYVDGDRIQSLRIKGFDPVIGEDGQIMEHRGDGYVKNLIHIDETGALAISINLKGMPERAALAAYAKDEFDVAMDAGIDVCDWAVAYGKYDGFSYQYDQAQHGLGFSIFGYEGKQDLRLALKTLLSYPPERSMDYSMLGRVIRTFHEKYVHQYLSRGNIGVIMGQDGEAARVVIRDLETAVLLSSFSPLQRYGYLLMDILRVIHHAIRCPEYGSTESPLWQYFMQSYLEPNCLVLGEEINPSSADMNSLCQDIFLRKREFNLIERVRLGKSDFSKMLDQELARRAGI